MKIKEIVYLPLKNKITKTDYIITRRVIYVGIINTIVGPSILFLVDNLLNNLVESYFFMQFFMFFFKGFMYKKFVFKEIKSNKSYIIPLILILWGFILANLIQGLNLLQIYKVILLLASITISNSIIALLSARLFKVKINN